MPAPTSVWSLLYLLAVTCNAEDSRLPWQRQLQGEPATRARQLNEQIEAAEKSHAYAEVEKRTRTLLRLRIEHQGKEHWEVRSVQQMLFRAETLARLSPEQQEAWRATTRELARTHELHNKGLYAAAQPALEKVLADTRRTLGEDHSSVAVCYHNLAINQHVQGEYEQARAYAEKAVARARRALGEIHPMTARMRNTLGRALEEQDNSFRAFAHHQIALRTYRQTVGDNHEDTGRGYAHVGMNLMRRGLTSAARPYLESALVIRLATLGKLNPDSAGSLAALAVLQDEDRQFRSASRLYRAALQIQHRLYGEHHADLSHTYYNLACNLESQGKHSEAQASFQKALAIDRKLRGEDHPDTARSYAGLATNLARQGNYAQAQPLCEQALRIKRRRLGESHSSVAESYQELASILSDQGKYHEAAELHARALRILRQSRGEMHVDTAIAYNNVGHTLASLCRFPEAQLYFERSLQLARSAGDQDPSFVGDLHNNLAYSLEMQGKSTQAALLYRKALQIERQMSGTGDGAAPTLCNLATCLYRQGQSVESERLFRQALDIARKKKGEHHPDTAFVHLNFACSMLAQRRFTEARTILLQGTRAHEASRLLMGHHGFDRAGSTQKTSPYQALACVQANLGDAVAAWRALEMDLARGYLDEAGLRRAMPVPARLQQAREQTTAELASVEMEVQETLSRSDDPARRKLLDSLLERQARLTSQLTNLAVEISQGAVASLEQVQATLPADAALVTWVNARDSFGTVQQHWACIVRRTSLPVWEQLPGQGPGKTWTKADDALPQQLLVALDQSASPARLTSLVQSVARQRLAPVEKHLVGVRRLHIVSSPDLACLPVEVLTDRYTISYVPSATWLARGKDAAPLAKAGLLALGDPQFASPARPDQGPALPPGGLLIQEVLPESSASRAHLQPGDVLVKYAGEQLRSFEHLSKLIERHARAKAIEVAVWREKQQIAIRVVPGGKLGVVFESEPADKALASRLKNDQMLNSLRGSVWQELPGTRMELESLQTLFGEQATVIRGARASRAQLDRLHAAGRLGQYRYLHFATHGDVNFIHAFESALILAAEHQEGQAAREGRLPAREVLQKWRLSADLVTLSACDTALGSEGGGDGMLGFAPAFLLAGARSVCLSLWQVDDTATALLMDRFYANLLGKREGLSKPLSKAAALAEAKRWLRELPLEEALRHSARVRKGMPRAKGEKPLLEVPTVLKTESGNPDRPFAHPRFWAAFILVGDPD